MFLVNSVVDKAEIMVVVNVGKHKHNQTEYSKPLRLYWGIEYGITDYRLRTSAIENRATRTDLSR